MNSVSPLVVTNEDVAAIERLFTGCRKSATRWLSEHVKDFVLLAPERLAQLLAPSDWQEVNLKARPYFLYGESLRLLRPLNATLVDRWLAEEHEEFWSESHAQYKLDYARGPTNCGCYFVSDEDKPHVRYFDVVAEVGHVAQRWERPKALALFTKAEVESTSKALEWLRSRESGWSVALKLYHFHRLFPERALEELKVVWSKTLKPYLEEWGAKARDKYRHELQTGHSRGNGEMVYFNDLKRVHSMDPELAKEVADVQDWQLLTARRDYYCSKKDDLYHVGLLKEMRKLQPLYAHFFEK